MFLYAFTCPIRAYLRSPIFPVFFWPLIDFNSFSPFITYNIFLLIHNPLSTAHLSYSATFYLIAYLYHSIESRACLHTLVSRPYPLASLWANTHTQSDWLLVLSRLTLRTGDSHILRFSPSSMYLVQTLDQSASSGQGLAWNSKLVMKQSSL